MDFAGVELVKRPAGLTVGALRAVDALTREHGVDILTASGNTAGLVRAVFIQPGGVHALLRIMYEGPVEDVVEDNLPVQELMEEFTRFFSGLTPPSAAPGGSSPEPPAE